MKADDAFSKNWVTQRAERMFGNPPYSRGTVELGHQGAAARKGREAAERGRKTVCLLLQATTDKVWFHEVLMGGADLVGKETIRGGPLEGVLLKLEASRCIIHVYFLKGRVSFINPATGGVAGTGTLGTMACVFSPRRW